MSAVYCLERDNIHAVEPSTKGSMGMSQFEAMADMFTKGTPFVVYDPKGELGPEFF